MELDRISNLPSEVIAKLLSHLSVREAVRTSVLSRKWRYRSAMLPHLVFDHQCVSTRAYKLVVNIVDHVLLGHIGPTHKFKLSHVGGVATWDIDLWILHLSRNSIKEFILEIRQGFNYTIPSCLFSSQDMIHLDLLGCVLKLPSTFKGFRNLKSLVFQRVTLAQVGFQNLIACCPLLERLTLLDFPFPILKIEAPNLQFLYVQGDFEDVIFENTLNLLDVCIDSEVGRRWVSDRSSNVVKFLVHLPHIQKFDIVGFSLQGDRGIGVLVWPADQESQAAWSEVKFLYGNRVFSLTQLRLVKISYIYDCKPELDFIRFLLLNSPVLEKMIVKPSSPR
ncbi:hypothetical protein L3X38_044071 [Prunus dulcis]|uniref:F-box domain-containing protein n=1 Tax=Prunus dulcis TaxID=3755 RepID=A0AAD4UXR7_PRUDU|nr:hypothetical protein L3X38_044071 [Prunus dulcis]